MDPRYQNNPPYPMNVPAGPPYPTGGTTYSTEVPPYPTGAPPYPGGPYNSGGGMPYPTAGAGIYYVDQPGMPGQNYDTENGKNQFSASFNDQSIRRSFIRKVYLILTVQLLVTLTFIGLFFIKPVSKWVKRNAWFYYLSYATFFVTFIALVCCPTVRRKFPGNFIALGIFTLAFSYMTATISAFYSINSVMACVAITAVVCLGISLFAIQTRFDFTMCSGFLLVLTLVVFITGIACSITFFVSGPNSAASNTLNVVYGGLAAFLFGMYLIYDTQMIMGGRKVELSPEEYIYGALHLYLDIVNLFLILLSLFGSRGD